MDTFDTMTSPLKPHGSVGTTDITGMIDNQKAIKVGAETMKAFYDLGNVFQDFKGFFPHKAVAYFRFIPDELKKVKKCQLQITLMNKAEREVLYRYNVSSGAQGAGCRVVPIVFLLSLFASRSLSRSSMLMKCKRSRLSLFCLSHSPVSHPPLTPSSHSLLPTPNPTPTCPPFAPNHYPGSCGSRPPDRVLPPCLCNDKHDVGTEQLSSRWS